MSRVPAISTPDGKMQMPVTTTVEKWSDDFGGNTINLSKWEVETNVGGMVPTVTGSTLTVNMGTAANAEYRLLSEETFTIPFDLWLSFKFSQRIANQDVWFEAVEVDPNTLLPITNDFLAGDWQNRASVRLNGTTVTTWIIEALGEEANALTSLSVANMVTTASDVDALLEIRACDILLTSVASNSVAARANAGGRVSTQGPDPNKLYKVRLRFKNGSTPPASATTVTINRVLVTDVNELSVEVQSGRGDAVAGKGLAVNVATMPSVTIGTLPATPAGTNLIGAIVNQASATVVSGTTAYRLLSAATTNLSTIKASAGKLIGGSLKNRSATEKFVKFYNKAAAPVLASDVPVFTVALSAGECRPINEIFGPQGHSFTTGIAIAITGGIADTDATAVAANDVLVNLTYA